MPVKNVTRSGLPVAVSVKLKGFFVAVKIRRRKVMSSYIERLCLIHGEWQMDVDNVQECPACESQGLLEIQRLRTEVEFLRQKADCGSIHGVCHFYADEICTRHEQESLRQQLVSKDAVIKELQGHLPDNCQRGECGKEDAVTVGDVSAQATNFILDRLEKLADYRRNEAIIEIADFIGDLAGKAVHGAITQRDVTICGMREVLGKYSKWEFMQEHLMTEGRALTDIRASYFQLAREVLSSPPSCPHKERAVGITRAETAEQARLINERDAAKEEVEKLEAKLSISEPVIGRVWLWQTDLDDLNARLVQAREALKGYEDIRCYSCREGWVCEKHPDFGWPHIDKTGNDCPGPGQPCENKQCIYYLRYNGPVLEKQLAQAREALGKIKHTADHYSGIVGRPITDDMYEIRKLVAESLTGKE